MYRNGVPIGITPIIIRLLQKIIRKVQNQGRMVPFAAAVGALVRRVAGLHLASKAFQTTGEATMGFVVSSPSNNVQYDVSYNT